MTGWRMQPTASALGVIAIVFVMITVTASESDSGAIEHSINHPGMDEEDRRVQEEPRTGNQSDIQRKNDTVIEMVQDSRLARFDDFSNVSQLVDELSVGLQRDQSVAVSFGKQNDVEVARDQIELDQRTMARYSESKLQDTRIFLVSTEPDREIVSSVSSLDGRPLNSKDSDEFNRGQLDEHSNIVDREHEMANGVKFEKQSKEDTVTYSTMFVPSIEQKGVEDIRAISFQVPSVVEEEERWQQQPRKPGETRKDNSRPVNTLLLSGGKATKSFYEIKPSIKTEMEDDQQSSSTQRPLPGKKFVLPSVDSAFGKFGPYFEDGDQEMNITARIGSTMLLDCKIGMLGDKEVTWLQQHRKDSLRLLTVGRKPYSVDQRISLNFRYPSNWRLQIKFANPRDSGVYKCQVATHPPLVKKINVVVTAPELTITDDSGRVVAKERHLKAGSALKLRCEARDVIESLEETVVWTRGDETLTEDVSENRTTEISSGKEVLVIVSTLIVERASPRHAGNYSCVVPGKAKTTIAVHVLNGELPAAVHDGNGVSRAFLNLWLIHLTISYVFSR